MGRLGGLMAFGDFWSYYDDDGPDDDGPGGYPTPDPGPPGGGTPPPGTPTTPGGTPAGGDKWQSIDNWLSATGEGEDGGGFPRFGGRSALRFDFGPVPRFNAPTFKAPTFEDAQNEPGYAFSLDQGRKALESSAAARGTLNTGGTLKGTLEYGQKLGAQNYQNVFNRALSVFDRLYQGELDMYKPLLTEWQTKAQGSQRAAELAWMREMDLYRAQIERWRHLTPSASDLIQLQLPD